MPLFPFHGGVLASTVVVDNLIEWKFDIFVYIFNIIYIIYVNEKEKQNINFSTLLLLTVLVNKCMYTAYD